MVDDWVIKTMYATKRRRKNNRTDSQTDCQSDHRSVKSSKRYPSQDHTAQLTPDYLCDIPANFCDPQLQSENHLQLFQNQGTIPLDTNPTQIHSMANNSNTSSDGQVVKSNPSKRHRERLNAELERLASLLPFDESVIVKLDKLSILRLAVSYLRMKCYFQTITQERNLAENRLVSHLYHFSMDFNSLEGEACLQALNGFIFIVSCDGEVFSVSQTVESYLGFHQSDILHQSVMELIHSEDREEFKRQLSWKQMLPYEHRNCTLRDLMTPKYCHLLQRCFTVRFRCLLDNTSGFITLEMSGRLQFLLGQSKGNSCEKNNASQQRGHQNAMFLSNADSPDFEKCPIGLFAVCSPLGPMPSLDAAHRDLTFKTKHTLDLGILNMDNRARIMFLFKESDSKSSKLITIYHYLHPDDLNYVSRGHKEVMKLGSIGLLVHRWLNKSGSWVWLQSRIKVVYKNGNPDHALAIHRQLSEEEGRELYLRRNNEYKLPFPLLEPETLLGDEDLTLDNSSKNLSPPCQPMGIQTSCLKSEVKSNFSGYLNDGERCAVQPKINKKSLNSYSLANQTKDYLNSSTKKKRKNNTAYNGASSNNENPSCRSGKYPQLTQNYESVQYFDHSRSEKSQIVNCQQTQQQPHQGIVLNSITNVNIYNNLYSNFNSVTNSQSVNGNWFDQNYDGNQLFSPNSIEESTQSYSSNFNEDCSAAWLAVVAAAASKYQTNGHNGSFDDIPYKKCHQKSLEQYQQFNYSQGNNYSQNANSTPYDLYNNNNNNSVFGYAQNSSALHANPSSSINFMQETHLETNSSSSTPGITNNNNNNDKSDLSSFLLQNVHNLSGSASSTDSIGSSELQLNSSYQSKMNSEFGSYSSLMKQVMDGSELKNAVHIPVVRHSWTDINSLPPREAKLEDQMMNGYNNPTAMFST